MSSLLNTIMVILFGLATIVLLAFVLSTKEWKTFFVEFSGLILILFVVVVFTGFPIPKRQVSFGGTSEVITVLLMFIFTLLGMGARYLFGLKSKFNLILFLKTLCVSPLIVLPLIGAVQGLGSIQLMQVIVFCLLAFENGFFWKTVLANERRK